MRVSDEGIAALVAHEGIVPGPYRDTVGVWTYGIGHTAAAGVPNPALLPRGMPADLDAALRQVFDVFRADLDDYEDAVTRAVKVPIAQHEFDALVSFHYNTGAIFRADLVKALNRGDRAAAAAGFMNWKRPSEIIARRQAEQRLFQFGAYPVGPAVVWRVEESGRVIWRPVRSLTQAQILAYLRPAEQPRPVPKPAPPAPANRPGPPGITIAGLLFGAAVAAFALIKWG